MIAYGANNWNDGLSRACRGGHLELAKLMISRGATKCIHCMESIRDHL
jgi:hypothetical protein